MNPQITEKAKKIISKICRVRYPFDADRQWSEIQFLSEALTDPELLKAQGLCNEWVRVGEWQICPKCNGQGIVCKPPWIPAEVDQWSSTGENHQCNLCNGAMVIQKPILPTQPNT